MRIEHCLVQHDELRLLIYVSLQLPTKYRDGVSSVAFTFSENPEHRKESYFAVRCTN